MVFMWFLTQLPSWYLSRLHAVWVSIRHAGHLLLFLGILFTGELWEFLSFAERYPTIIYNILLFGLTSALGQVSSLEEAAWLPSCLGAEGIAVSLGICGDLRAVLALTHRLFLELYLHDSRLLWSPDLLHHHHNTEVLHHLGFCDPLRQPHQLHAVGGHCAGFPG